MNWKLLIKVLTVFAALASAVAAWMGGFPEMRKLFQGFDPHLTIVSIAIAKGPTKAADNKIALFLNVSSSNSSDKAGCLSDFAIRLRDIAGGQGPDTSASIEGSFSAIYMSAESSVDREIAFMHRPHSSEGKDIMTVETLKPGSYQVELLVSASGLPCAKVENYKPAFDAPISFKLSESLIGDVRKGSLVHPADADLDQRRETLMRSPTR